MRTLNGRDERGAVIVLMAMSMIVLLTFAALAVDYGALTNERRRDQTSADAAALAAGGQLKIDAGEDAAVDEAIEVSWENLETGLTLPEWRQRFDSDCADPDKPASYVASTLSDCISFNAFMSRVRVKLPDLAVDASFARVIGVDSMVSTASAEAELVSSALGRVLPFGVPTASSGSTELCLKSGPAPDDAAPCSGPDEGNFGSIDISLYGNPVMGTPEICGNTAPNLKLSANMILGTDHALDEYAESPADPAGSTPEAIRNDHSLCPDLGARPNELWAQTGVASNLDPGMISGMVLDGRSLPGRLTQGPFATRAVKDGVPPLDDRPLWEYIPNAPVAGAPASCQRSAFVGAMASKAQMNTCLRDYAVDGSTAELFTEDSDLSGEADIVETPRFAFVPLFHLHQPSGDDTFHSGTDRYQIAKFIPVFVQTVYFKCNPGGCRAIFDPGELGFDLPAAANEGAEALTAMLIPDTALSEEARALGPGIESDDDTLILRR